MSIQKNTDKQNGTLSKEIKDCALFTLFSGAAPQWLIDLITSNGFSFDSGILIRLTSIPEQEGDYFSGLWLTNSHEFWQFSVIVNRTDKTLIGVDSFNNITSTVVISAHTKGTGKSFGYLAIEVLDELFSG
ncbi:hypothetical protein [Thiothrix nivea]|uniref:hypothetical protein n=1 Tax=Thiothrix nivea TaxID=1031 RepID=UPI0012B69339|nr:hypothetical protein [Thiothrix nivea]